MRPRASAIERALAAARGGNLVENPELRGSGGTPRDWAVNAPRPALLPRSAVEEGQGGKRSLVLSSTGDPRLFGCWSGRARLQAGQWYVASVRARVRDIANARLSVLALVAKHVLVPVRQRGDGILLAQVFRHGVDTDGEGVELYLRAAERGSVTFTEPRVRRVAEPEWRAARVATARFGAAPEGLTVAAQRSRVREKLDTAGALEADFVLLPEFSPVVGVRQESFGDFFRVAEQVPGGPLCRTLAAAAKRHSMYVCAGNIERRGSHMYNTAVLFDRKGRFVGQYDKTHLTIGELRDGFSCGNGYPVFDLDFGRIGIHICYDEWFPEVAGQYAQRGVEVLFLPVAGGKPITWRTRALDNGMHFVSASITPPSMVIESSGVVLSETHDDGVAYADLNMERREVNWYRDPTLSYGMPCVVPEMLNVVDGDQTASQNPSRNLSNSSSIAMKFSWRVP